jgi:hypothetical protein
MGQAMAKSRDLRTRWVASPGTMKGAKSREDRTCRDFLRGTSYLCGEKLRAWHNALLAADS